jgi:lipoprotein signal peptidase
MKSHVKLLVVLIFVIALMLAGVIGAILDRVVVNHKLDALIIKMQK